MYQKSIFSIKNQKGVMSIFQVVLLGVFGVFLLVGFLAFSGIIPLFERGGAKIPGVSGKVVMWGTIPADYLERPLGELNRGNKNQYSIQYKEISPLSFDQELIEALASGRGPDLILLPENLIVRHADKIYPLPYDYLSERDFKDIFVDEGELYLRTEGILALPLTIDPMVLYWNRDLFNTANVSLPPKFWDEFYTLSSKMTLKDSRSNVLRSTVALGEYRNVTHAKDILSLLIFQAGNKIVAIREKGIIPVLQDREGLTSAPAESALRFFTEFSNPVKPFYSWNRALPDSKDFFIRGDLGVYMGFASELPEIRQKNPHLNFDAALVPQARGAAANITFGKMLGVAALKQSKNANTAFYALIQMSDNGFVNSFVSASGLPPARRDLLALKPGDPFLELFYRSVLISRSWLDPDPEQTDIVFRDMVENTVSGRVAMRDAVARAHAELVKLFK